MTIAKVLAMYKTAPIVLVVEAEDGTVVELSLADLHGAGHRWSDIACTSLVEAYQLFTAQATRREGVRLARSARHHRPPARD